jgi:hypothetical protein
MDAVFGFLITIEDTRILFAPGDALQPADILFSSTVWGEDRYRRLLSEVKPRLFVPLHWENFFRRLDRPLLEMAQPGRMSLKRLERLTSENAPGTKFMLPDLLKVVDLSS